MFAIALQACNANDAAASGSDAYASLRKEKRNGIRNTKQHLSLATATPARGPGPGCGDLPRAPDRAPGRGAHWYRRHHASRSKNERGFAGHWAGDVFDVR